MSANSRRAAATYDDRRGQYGHLSDTGRNREVALSDRHSKNLQVYNDYTGERRGPRSHYNDDKRLTRRQRSSSPSSAQPFSRHHRSRNSSRDRDRRARSLSHGRWSVRGTERNADQFVDRNFDTSRSGFIAAAAGGALGALGARRIGHSNPYDPQQKQHHLRTIGGALVGAAAANAGDKKWRGYVDDKEESKR